MECVYCKHTYANRSSLGKHQTTAKSCLAIQRKMGIEISPRVYACVCGKTFTSKENSEKHKVLCKKNDNVEEKLEQLSFELRTHKEEIEYEMKIKDDRIAEELSVKDAKIKELEERLSKNDKPSKTKINNTTNIEHQTNNITIYQLMTPELVEDFFKKHYHLETLLGGQKALARFVNDGFLKEAGVYTCGDRSRQKFYIVKGGKKEEDTDCNEILELTSPGLPRVQEVYENALFSDLTELVTEDDIHDNYEQIINLDENRTEFKAELSKIITSDVQLNEEKKKQTFKDRLQKMKKKKELFIETPVTEPVEYIKREDVLGFSRGKLMVYRDRYKKDGTIKGPHSILEQIQHDEEARQIYMSFLNE